MKTKLLDTGPDPDSNDTLFDSSNFPPTTTNRNHNYLFPSKLYRLLEHVDEKGLNDIISWSEDGRSIALHKPRAFSETLYTEFFGKAPFRNFQRNLYLYGFKRILPLVDGRFYSHPLFLRGKEDQLNLIKRITRKAVHTSKSLSNPQKKSERKHYILYGISSETVIFTQNEYEDLLFGDSSEPVKFTKKENEEACSSIQEIFNSFD
jgi:hypothetical protein